MSGTAAIFKDSKGRFAEVFPHDSPEAARAFLNDWFAHNQIRVGGVAVKAVEGHVASGNPTFNLEPPIPGNELGLEVITALANAMNATGFSRIDVIDPEAPDGKKVLLTVTDTAEARPTFASLDELGVGQGDYLLGRGGW